MTEDPSPDPSVTPSDPDRRKNRVSWRTIVLVVSLGLNLLILGLIVGAMLGGGPRDRNPALRDAGYGPFARALSREDRRAIASEMKRQEKPFLDNRRALRRDFETFLALLRADTLDATALETTITRQRARVSERQRLASLLLLDRIVAMTPEQRLAYADRLDRLLKRRGAKTGPNANGSTDTQD